MCAVQVTYVRCPLRYVRRCQFRADVFAQRWQRFWFIHSHVSSLEPVSLPFCRQFVDQSSANSSGFGFARELVATFWLCNLGFRFNGDAFEPIHSALHKIMAYHIKIDPAIWRVFANFFFLNFPSFGTFCAEIIPAREDGNSKKRPKIWFEFVQTAIADDVIKSKRKMYFIRALVSQAFLEATPKRIAPNLTFRSQLKTSTRTMGRLCQCRELEWNSKSLLLWMFIWSSTKIKRNRLKNVQTQERKERAEKQNRKTKIYQNQIKRSKIR